MPSDEDGSTKRSEAEILHEYGPFPGVDHVHGVTFDGQHVWIAAGDTLKAFDPVSGKTIRSIAAFKKAYADQMAHFAAAD